MTPGVAGVPETVVKPATVVELPSSQLPVRSGLALLRDAHVALADAAGARTSAERYALAHVAALRAAAAVLATRARPVAARRRARPASVWDLLVRVAPELGEWAVFFAACAGKRAAAEAGVTTAVTAREADDQLRDAQAFLTVVEQSGQEPSGSQASPPVLPFPGASARRRSTAAHSH
jgi:hypothetical protein